MERLRLDDTSRFRLFVIGAKEGVRPTQLASVIDRWTRSAAGDYQTASDLAGPDRTSAVLRTIRDVMISHVDFELQRCYRDFLKTRQDAAHLPHYSRIHALEAVTEQANEIVNRFDWNWLDDWMGIDVIQEGTSLQRLSNFALPQRRVNIRMTYHCNAACRHCYNESGPSRKQQMLDIAAVGRLIDEMPDAGIPRLNLTGGEPFLYLDYITAAVERARLAGVSEVSLYTNGFWASTPGDAERILDRLSRAGFMSNRYDHIKVSTGRYHQEFVSLECVDNLARCYWRRFAKPLIVDVELDASHPADEEVFRERFGSGELAESISLHFRYVVPHGRGSLLPTPALGEISSPCRIIDQLSLDPDGTARPCCGFNNENQGVIVGDIRTHSLKTLVKRMQNDPLLQLLANRPMSRVFDLVSANANPQGYPNACSLCQHAIGDLREKSVVFGKLFDTQSFYPFWFNSGTADFAHAAFPAP